MPKLLTTPFAAESQLRTNIQESQGAESNSATYQFGFPEETMKKIALGGKPPKGEDMNGILYDLSDNIVFQTQGGRYKFDPTYANKIGGYPVNSILQLENGTEVLNKTPNNVTNPNVDMTGWETIEPKNIIKTVESIEDLMALTGMSGGDVVFVKGYNVNTNFGGGIFIFSAQPRAVNDVNIFSGSGGVWLRHNWLSPTIYDAGILSGDVDSALRFSKLLLAAQGKKVSLCGEIVNLSYLDVPSNTYIQDGHLDFSTSTIQPNWMNAFIVGANKDRSKDMEQKSVWDAADRLENVTFENVEHTFPVDNSRWKNAAIYQKCSKVLYFRCTFNLQAIEALKFSGCTGEFYSLLGTDMWSIPSADDAYYNHTIAVISCTFSGVIEPDSQGVWNGPTGVRVSGTKSFVGIGNTFDNTLGAIWFDTFNDGGYIHQNSYSVGDIAALDAFVDGRFSGDEFIGFYVGQCTQNATLSSNTSRNAGYAGIYLESAKSILIDSNKTEYDYEKTNAISCIIQSNILNSPDIVKGVQDVIIRNNEFKGAKWGVWINGQSENSHQHITIDSNIIHQRTPLSSVVLSNVAWVTCSSNNCNGNIHVAGNTNNATISCNFVKSKSNTAFRTTIVASNSSNVFVYDNHLEVEDGAVIYNGASLPIQIVGGLIGNSGGALMQSTVGASALICSNYRVNNMETLVETLELSNLDIAAGGSISRSINLAGVRSGWGCDLRLHSQPSGGGWISAEVVTGFNTITLRITNTGSADVFGFTTLVTASLSTLMNQFYGGSN